MPYVHRLGSFVLVPGLCSLGLLASIRAAVSLAPCPRPFGLVPVSLVPSASVLPALSCALLLLPAIPSNPFFQGVWLSFLFFSGGVPLPIWLRQKGFWGILGFGVGSGSRNG